MEIVNLDIIFGDKIEGVYYLDGHKSAQALSHELIIPILTKNVKTQTKTHFIAKCLGGKVSSVTTFIFLHMLKSGLVNLHNHEKVVSFECGQTQKLMVDFFKYTPWTDIKCFNPKQHFDLALRMNSNSIIKERDSHFSVYCEYARMIHFIGHKDLHCGNPRYLKPMTNVGRGMTRPVFMNDPRELSLLFSGFFDKTNKMVDTPVKGPLTIPDTDRPGYKFTETLFGHPQNIEHLKGLVKVAKALTE
tara:strand:- start:181853 stop:182590 length:738 start_codon:yes stop_codon:yes gene_type:complete